MSWQKGAAPLDRKNTDFTQGNILKKLLYFMVPVLGALVLQAAYGAVDLLVVGRFGSTSGLSAVSTGSQILNLVTFVVTQLAMGITVLIARYLGEKRPQLIGPVLGGAILVFALISVGLCVVLVGFARPIRPHSPQSLPKLLHFQIPHPSCGAGRSHPHRHTDTDHLAKDGSANLQCGQSFNFKRLKKNLEI